MKVYTSPNGFSLQESGQGWRWQETGADGWSRLYDTRAAAITAISMEFATLELAAAIHIHGGGLAV